MNRLTLEQVIEIENQNKSRKDSMTANELFEYLNNSQKIFADLTYSLKETMIELSSLESFLAESKEESSSWELAFKNVSKAEYEKEQARKEYRKTLENVQEIIDEVLKNHSR